MDYSFFNRKDIVDGPSTPGAGSLPIEYGFSMSISINLSLGTSPWHYNKKNTSSS